MTVLVACLSTGKGTWSSVNNLLRTGLFEKAVIVTNQFGFENFNPPQGVELVLIDPSKGEAELRDSLVEELRGRVTGAEVALNLSSGSGREHMALLSALLKLGVGIRLVTPSSEGFEEL